LVRLSQLKRKKERYEIKACVEGYVTDGLRVGMRGGEEERRWRGRETVERKRDGEATTGCWSDNWKESHRRLHQGGKFNPEAPVLYALIRHCAVLQVV